MHTHIHTDIMEYQKEDSVTWDHMDKPEGHYAT
jgi:hypothetical protein